MLLFLIAMLGAGCRRDMADQPKLKPLGESAFFKNDAASRLLPAHTIARGQLREDTHFFTGKINGAPVSTLPAPISRAMLDRGRERYDIFCSVCHGRTGEGFGMIVQRGFPPPPSFHIARLREAPVGYFFEVISNGYGLMYAYGSRVEVADRWAIAAYIRVLQLSTAGTLEDVPEAERKTLEAAQP